MPRTADLLPIIARVLRENDGVAHLQRFVEAGVTPVQVGHFRHTGHLIRIRIGWYADPVLSQAAIRAVRVGGVLGCTSAAASWGIVTPEHSDRLLEVSILPGTTRLRRADDASRRARAGSDRGVRWHWDHHELPAQSWRVSPPDAILQMAACVGFRWLVAAVDSARRATQHEPILTKEGLELVRTALPQRLRGAVDRSDPRSETSGETFIRLELEDRGLPFVPQQWLTAGYRPDGLVDGWLPIEIDVMQTHSGAEAVERDRERDGTIALFTTPPVRFTQTQAVRDTAFVADSIEAVWRRGRPSNVRGSAETRRRAGESAS